MHSTSDDKPSAQSIHNITRIFTPDCNILIDKSQKKQKFLKMTQWHDCHAIHTLGYTNTKLAELQKSAQVQKQLM